MELVEFDPAKTSTHEKLKMGLAGGILLLFYAAFFGVMTLVIRRSDRKQQARRREGIMGYLKERFPGLNQTELEIEYDLILSLYRAKKKKTS